MKNLTVREMEVAKLKAEGLSNAATAKRLGISPLTVKVHVVNIYAKYEVSNAVQLSLKLRESNG